jgi:Stanniocalcin family
MAMKNEVFIFIIGLLAAFNLQASSCSYAVGICEYYMCLESHENCGPNGYYLDFGLHYCNKYKSNESFYTTQGQDFLVNIRTCLQEELEREQIRTGQFPMCSEVKKIAVDTHKYCYEKYNFCELPTEDQINVKLSAASAIFDLDILKFAFWLEKSCNK